MKPEELKELANRIREDYIECLLQDERIVIEALHQIVVELELQIRLNKNII